MDDNHDKEPIAYSLAVDAKIIFLITSPNSSEKIAHKMLTDLML